MKKEIIISRMYSGTYLRENLGHEIINLFKSDNGKNYIYLNDVGTYGKEHDAIESVLLVRTLYGANTVEVLGVAKGLHPVYSPVDSPADLAELNKAQKEYIKTNAITYGGAQLDSIFSNEPIPSVYITFEAEKVLRVNKDKHIFIRFTDKENMNAREIDLFENDVLVKLEDVKLGHELKSYIAEGDSDWSSLKALIDDASNWGEETQPISMAETPEEQSLLAVCKKEDDELVYSNMMAFFAVKYPSLTQEFLGKVLHPDVKGGLLSVGRYSFTVERERGHIDILIYDKRHLYVFENKIKSGINGIEYDADGNIVKTQLDDYIAFAKDFIKGNGLDVMSPEYYLLVPDYHPITRYHENPVNPYVKYTKIGKGLWSFMVVKYSLLYNYLLPKTKKAPYSKDAAFKEFVKALEKHTHTYDDSIYDEMRRRFYDRINVVNDWR